MNYCPFALPTVGKRVANPNLFDNKWRTRFLLGFVLGNVAILCLRENPHFGEG